LASRAREEVDDISKRVTGSYRQALEQARGLAVGAGGTWEETKAKAADAYNEAFHKGHGKSRSLLGKFRGTLGRGVSNTAHFAMAACHKTWDALTHMVMAVVYAALGGALTVWGLSMWRRRKFHKQLNANVSGPIVAIGEYMILGQEEQQRKFFDFWSGPAASYFNKQPGLRKQWMHRGVPDGTNTWLAYSEWASIEDLRRAVRSHEYAELKKRAPKPAVTKMFLYQLGSVGSRNEMGESVDGPSKETGERGLRQRGTSTAAPAAHAN